MSVVRQGLALQSQRFTGAGPHDFVLPEDILAGCDALGITITMLDVNANPDPVQKVEFEQGAAFVEATREQYRRRSSAKTYLYYGLAPDTGSGKIVRVTLNFAPGSGYRVTVYRLEGVDQVTPVPLSAAADSASSSPLSLEGAPFDTDPDGYFIGATSAHSNTSGGWTAGGGPTIDHDFTNDGGFGHCVMSDEDPLASGYDPTIDQGTTTRSIVYLGMWFAPSTAAPPGQPSIDGENAKDDDSFDVATTPGTGADSHALHGEYTPGVTPGPGNLLVDQLPANVTSVYDDGHAGNGKIYLVLRATNASGNTDSAEREVVLALERPSSIQFTNIETIRVTVTVLGGGVGAQDVTEVLRKPFGAPDSAYQVVWNEQPSSFVNDGLQPDTQYTYKARFFDVASGAWSRYSEEAHVTTASQQAGMMLLRRRRVS